jgi:hypothetical protein
VTLAPGADVPATDTRAAAAPPPAAGPTTSTAGAGQPRHAAAPAQRIRLGEELPVFCERCGYSLNALPQNRCEQCGVLHFACPECNHHQPINTLRPAAQRILGRLRAWWLAILVLFRIAYFGLLLLAWFAMGAEWSYRYDYGNVRRAAVTTATTAPAFAPPRAWQPPPLVPAPVTLEMIVAFVAFGLGFGLVSRMLLLRWRRGWLVGLVLACVVLAAVAAGAWFNRQMVFNNFGASYTYGLPPPPDASFYAVALLGALCIVLGASVVWGAWTALAHLFLPRTTAAALLDWQRSLSGKEASLAR